MRRPIEYNVSLTAPQTQTLQIRMRIPDAAPPFVDVAMPVWRQGRYAILNPAGTVHRVRAEAESGRPLPISKIDKTTWRIPVETPGDVAVAYDVYANSLNDRTRHLDDTHAFLSGATVFFYVAGRRTHPVRVHVDAPQDWKIATGLTSEPGRPRELQAPDYDVLIDSPIEAGLHDIVTFAVDGKEHEIAIWGEPRFDAGQLRRDFAAIVRSESAIFGDIPYERYVFLIHAAPGLGGGTEHLNSTIMQTPARAFEDPSQYKRLLSLAAHEMFHTWNVKRLRPAALRTPDLSAENYTDLLWFCEGTTAYYDELIVVRIGMEDPDSYLKLLADAIYQQRARPGSRVQSLAESSFDAWIKFNQPTADDVNSTVSFYDNGALVSMLLDLEMRRRTANRGSLDTLLREMYRTFPSTGPGFTCADLLQAVDRVTASSFGEFFDRYIHGTERYPFEEVFGAVGLEMREGSADKPYIGLATQPQGETAAVRAVLSDGPCYLAGVNAGDQILAFNGQKLAPDELGVRVDAMRPGDPVRLDIQRRGRQRTIEFRLGVKPNPRWELVRQSAASSAAREAYATWLGQPWPG